MIGRSKGKSIYFLVAGIVLGIFSFFYIDPYISTFCIGMSHASRNYLKGVSRVLSPPFHMIFWCMIYLITKYRCASHVLTSISRHIFYSLLFSLSLVYGMKILFGRARPELLVDNIYGFYFMMHNHHYHSFPSGHAAVATCLFAPLLYNFPKFRIGWIVLPILLSSSRIVLNYHYPSDILASGMISYMVQGLCRKYRDKKKGNRIYSIRFPKA